MNSQHDLEFTPPKPRQLSSLGKNLQLVSLSLMQRGDDGATDEELSQITGLAGNSVRPRRIDLVNHHRCANSGRKRKTLYGRAAIVWVWTGSKHSTLQ